MTGRPDFAGFLSADFERLGEGLLNRCASLDGKRLYLTGATGFFGKNLLALFSTLHRRGKRFEVTALSRDPDAFLAAEPILGAAPWLTLLFGDVGRNWPQGHGNYDLLLHAATDTHASAHADKKLVFESMFAGARNMVAFCEQSGVRRLLLTGSGAQFGPISPDQWPNGVADDAALACNPTQAASAYGEGKRVAELMAALHAQNHRTAVTYARCFAFVGPGLPLDGHFAIGNFIRDATAGQTIRLRSAGFATRSYLYSADLAVWLLLALLEAPAGTRLNVGSDEGLSVLQLASRVRDALGCDNLDILPGAPVSEEARQFYLPAITRARQLGLEPWTSLDHAIRRTAIWARTR